MAENNKTVKKENTKVEKKSEEKIEAKATETKPKNFAPEYLVKIRSTFKGRLHYYAPVSKMTRDFAENESGYIRYDDLIASVTRKEGNFYNGDLVIQDEDVLEQVYFEDLKKIYNKGYDSTFIKKLVEKPARVFKQEFSILSNSVKKSVASYVADQIREGEFDSLNKINIIDSQCGTDLKLLFNPEE